ncbi:MAG: hypothetical protein KR126chlam2_00692 [Chlamydiae bacterium]|nr:hypothetical protein [Chlamydiota bacterium]
MSTEGMGPDATAVGAIVGKLLPSSRKSDKLPCSAKIAAAVVSVFFVIGLATIIIPNFVAASSLPMPLANIRMIGILVASASLISAFPIGLIVGAWEKRSARSSEAKVEASEKKPRGSSSASAAGTEPKYGDLDAESSDSGEWGEMESTCRIGESAGQACHGHPFTVSEIASATHHASNKAANTERDFLESLPPGTWYCADSNDDDSDSSTSDW